MWFKTHSFAQPFFFWSEVYVGVSKNRGTKMYGL